jgi:hypothetical protein
MNRRSKKKSSAQQEEIGQRLSEVQNLVYERCQAQRQLPILAGKAERDSVPMLPLATSSELSITTQIESAKELIRSTGPTLRQIDAYVATLTDSDDRIMILQQTSSWVAQLYSQWTTLSENTNGEDAGLFDADAVADLTADMESGTMQTDQSTDRKPQSTRGNIVPEPLQPQQEVSIFFEDEPHQNKGFPWKCNCIRAKVWVPTSLSDELKRLNAETSESLWLWPAHLPSHPANFLQMTERRNELEHTYHVQYLLPLYKKYLARLSDLLAIADSELAELYRQRGEAGTSWERQKTITDIEIPPLFQRRRHLSDLVKQNMFCIQLGTTGYVVVEPAGCSKPELIVPKETDVRTGFGSASSRKDGAAMVETLSDASDVEWGSASDPEAGERDNYTFMRKGQSRKSAWETGVYGMSAKMALKLKAKANEAKEGAEGRKERQKREKELISEDDDRNRRFQSPQRHSERPERPRVVTSDRSKSSRVSSSKVEFSAARPQDVRRDSGRRSSRDSPPINRHNGGRAGPLFGTIDDDDVSSFVHKPGFPEHNQYSRHFSQDRDYLPASPHHEDMFGSRRTIFKDR